jgi:outer membrane protein assembly factor BamB
VRSVVALLLALGVAACARTPAPEPPPPPPARFDQPVELQRAWTAGVGRTPATDSYRLVPALAQGYLYTGSASGRVTALDAQRGREVWRQDLGRPLSGGPGAGAGLLVFGTREGEVIALNAADGSVRWQASVTSEVLSVPAVARGVVVVRSGDGRAFGLDAASGRRLWIHDRTPPVLTLRGVSNPVIAGDLVLIGLASGRLLALNLRDGAVAWEVEVAAPRGRTELERMVDIDGDPAVFGNEAYAASYQGRIVGVGLQTGRVGWGRDFSTHLGLGADAERVYATDIEGRLWAFDRFSGAAAWRLEELRAVRLTAPVPVGDHLVIGDSSGHLNWVRVRDGELRDRTRVGRGEIRAAPVVAGGRVYVLTSNGELVAFDLPDPR